MLKSRLLRGKFSKPLRGTGIRTHYHHRLNTAFSVGLYMSKWEVQEVGVEVWYRYKDGTGTKTSEQA